MRPAFLSNERLFLRPLVEGDAAVAVLRTAETGSSMIGPACRGKGYGTEAKHLLLEYYFDRLGLHAICSHVWEPKTRSAAVLAMQGYRLAGRLKWDDLKDGIYRDTLVFDLLRDDWLAAREPWGAGIAAPLAPNQADT